MFTIPRAASSSFRRSTVVASAGFSPKSSMITRDLSSSAAYLDPLTMGWRSTRWEAPARPATSAATVPPNLAPISPSPSTSASSVNCPITSSVSRSCVVGLAGTHTSPLSP